MERGSKNGLSTVQWSSNCNNYGIIFLFNHFKPLPGQIFRSPTSNFLLALGLLLLTSEAAACSSSPLLQDFYCAATSWKVSQLIECQMCCRPLSWALKLWGRAWIRGKVLRSDHRKSVLAGTWMRNIKFAHKLIYLSFFYTRNTSLLGHFCDYAINILTVKQVARELQNSVAHQTFNRE